MNSLYYLSLMGFVVAGVSFIAGTRSAARTRFGDADGFYVVSVVAFAVSYIGFAFLSTWLRA